MYGNSLSYKFLLVFATWFSRFAICRRSPEHPGERISYKNCTLTLCVVVRTLIIRGYGEVQVHDELQVPKESIFSIANIYIFTQSPIKLAPSRPSAGGNTTTKTPSTIGCICHRIKACAEWQGFPESQLKSSFAATTISKHLWNARPSICAEMYASRPTPQRPSISALNLIRYCSTDAAYTNQHNKRYDDNGSTCRFSLRPHDFEQGILCRHLQTRWIGPTSCSFSLAMRWKPPSATCRSRGGRLTHSDPTIWFSLPVIRMSLILFTTLPGAFADFFEPNAQFVQFGTTTLSTLEHSYVYVGKTTSGTQHKCVWHASPGSPAPTSTLLPTAGAHVAGNGSETRNSGTAATWRQDHLPHETSSATYLVQREVTTAGRSVRHDRGRKGRRRSDHDDKTRSRSGTCNSVFAAVRAYTHY
jgi:hypothetical protein